MIGRSLPKGIWGMALLIAAETTLIATLIASYAYLALAEGAWPPDGVPEPSLLVPLLLTGLLLVSGLPTQGASRAARRGSVRPAWLLLLAATAIQGAYLAIQIDLFVADLAELSPEGSAYESAYFTLLGTHHAHVALGLLINAWLIGKLAMGLTGYRTVALRAAALYWWFIIVSAVAVVFTQISPAL